MRPVFLLFLLHLFVLSSNGQTRVPVYRSAADSTRLAQFVNIVMRKAFNEKHTAEYFDSLKKVEAQLVQKLIVKYRYIFQPNSTYTTLQQLEEGSVDPQKVITLSIFDYDRKTLPKALFKCANVQKLELVNTSVDRLPKRVQKLKKLKHLTVYNPKNPERIKVNRRNVITTLRIRGGDPINLPVSFAKFRRLDTLDLQQNHLTKFPNVEENRHLKQLLLGENELTLENDEIENDSLQHLGLQRNKIKTVPTSIGNLKALKKLTLNYNKISEIEDGFSQLKNLEELALYSNRLITIPEEIFELEKLQFVDLYFNEIQTIEDDIQKLRNLEILYLASNNIHTISTEINKLSKLKELYLHHNDLHELPDLRGLSGLQVLRVNTNRISNVPGWMRDLKNLKNLDLSQNNIVYPPQELLELPKLEIVSLTENKWEDLTKVEEVAKKLYDKGVIVHFEQLGR
jgi:Leucine-rich repeat (LRR) protein